MASSPVLAQDRTKVSSATVARPLARVLQLCVVASLALVARVGIYLALPSHWKFDQLLPWDGWGRIAVLMSKGYGLSDNYLMTYFPLAAPQPTASRPPLPVFLFAAVIKLFGEKLFPVIVTQAIIDVGSSVLIYLIIRRLFQQGAFVVGPALKLGTKDDSERFGHITGLVGILAYAFYLPEWPYAIGFQSEPLFTLLLTAAMVFVLTRESRNDVIAAGIFFGLAALARPSIILFPIMLTPWLIWGRKLSWKRVVLMPVLTFVVLIPWGVRNYVTFHHFIITESLAGYNLYRNSTQIESDNYIRFVSGEEGNPKIIKLLESRGLSPQTISEPDLDRLLRNEAIKVIVAHPGRYLNLCAHRALWLYYDGEAGSQTTGSLPYVYLGMTLSLLGMIVFTLWRYRGPWIKQLMPIWMLFFYIIPIHAMIVSQVRYFLPLVPILICVAAYGTARVIAELRGAMNYRSAKTV
jgi:4-amino-4-deoxy-L-arabinose transferase-like glycosyltransferase